MNFEEIDSTTTNNEWALMAAAITGSALIAELLVLSTNLHTDAGKILKVILIVTFVIAVLELIALVATDRSEGKITVEKLDKYICDMTEYRNQITTRIKKFSSLADLPDDLKSDINSYNYLWRDAKKKVTEQNLDAGGLNNIGNIFVEDYLNNHVNN